MAIDLVVGIDVGMSGTGVAYARQPENKVQCLFWGQDRKAEKIPTRIAYAGNEYSREPLYWGFDIPDSRDDLRIKEWFKTDLGRRGLDQQDVEAHYADYLKLLHGELSRRLAHEVLGDKAWAEFNIGFVFSVPTTWDTATIDRFKCLAAEAGFEKAGVTGRDRGVHTVAVGLVEPHATAAYQLCHPSNEQLTEGQHVMVVDAGAGTGDFCRLEIGRDADGISVLCESQPPNGSELGSGYIDQDFEKRMTKILEPYESSMDSPPRSIAREMRCSEQFQDFKHQLGQEHEGGTEVPVPHLKNPQGSLGDRVQNGLLVNPEKELRPLFDKQVDKITAHVSALAGIHRDAGPQLSKTPVDCTLLSGGLGSSPYVQSKLERFCRSHPRLKSTKVVVTKRPRLAVCMGLVFHAITTHTVFPAIACRASFGLLCRVPNAPSAGGKWKSMWTQMKQLGRSQSHEPVVNCVDWFVKKGTKINNGEVLTFEHAAFFKRDQARVCHVKIVASYSSDPSPLEKDLVPAQDYMRLDLSLAGDDKADKRGRVFWRKEPHIKINFWTRAQIGLAEAQFFCVDKAGNKISEPVNFSVGDSTPLVRLLTGLDEVEEELGRGSPRRRADGFFVLSHGRSVVVVDGLAACKWELK